MNIDTFLGEDCKKNFSDIMPIIRLILYHMDEGKKRGIFGYDDFCFPKHKIIKRVIWEYGKIRYFICRWRQKGRKKEKENAVYLSDTILGINRYESLLQEMDQECLIVASLTVNSCALHLLHIRHRIEREFFNKRTIDLGRTIIDESVKNSVDAIYDSFIELCKYGRTCADDKEKMFALFKTLQITVQERLNEIGEILIQNNINLFITINQLNLSDVLIIMACRKKGIRTKELEHFSSCSVPISSVDEAWYGIDKIIGSEENKKCYFPENQSYKLKYTDELCQWGESDVKYYKKYWKIFNMLDSKCTITNVGCPEITFKEVEKKMAKYSKRNSITLFVPSDVFYLGMGHRDVVTPSSIGELKKRREELFRQIKQLSIKENVSVYVKYHPTEPIEYINNEKSIIEELGYTLLSADREEFYKSLCYSRAVFGSGSSTLVVATIFGCKSYCIKFSSERYDFCGRNIEVISVNQIPEVYVPNIDECCEMKGEECINVKQLIQS